MEAATGSRNLHQGMFSFATARSQPRGGSPALPCSQITVDVCCRLVPSTSTSVLTSPDWPPSPDSDEGGEERARSQKVEAPAGGSRAGGLPCRSRGASAAEESCPLADARPSTRSAWYALDDVHILLARLMLAIAEADAVHPRPLGICTNGDPQFAAHNSRTARRNQRAGERSEAILLVWNFLNLAKVNTSHSCHVHVDAEGIRDCSASSRAVCAAAQGQRGRDGMGDVF